MKKVLSWEESYFEGKPDTSHTHNWIDTALKDSHTNHEHQDDVIKSSENHAKTFTPEHHKAVKEYMNESDHINRPLRKGLEPVTTEDETKTSFDKRVPLLDHVTSNKLPHDTVAYRGVHHSMSSMPSGTIFKDKGFTGTSLNKEMAVEHAEDKRKKSDEGLHVARIHLKKGEKGAYLPVSHGDVKHSFDSEEELLLPRGNHYKVIGHHIAGGIHHIDLEIHHPKGKE